MLRFIFLHSSHHFLNPSILLIIGTLCKMGTNEGNDMIDCLNLMREVEEDLDPDSHAAEPKRKRGAKMRAGRVVQAQRLRKMLTEMGIEVPEKKSRKSRYPCRPQQSLCQGWQGQRPEEGRGLCGRASCDPRALAGAGAAAQRQSE